MRESDDSPNYYKYKAVIYCNKPSSTSAGQTHHHMSDTWRKTFVLIILFILFSNIFHIHKYFSNK